MDTTNRNNLVFYGIKEDGVTAEFGVKEVIRRSDYLSLRFYLHKINRENMWTKLTAITILLSIFTKQLGSTFLSLRSCISDIKPAVSVVSVKLIL